MKENGAVKRIILILDLISKNPQGITLGEITRKLKMPKSTAYDILQTLYLYDAVYYRNPDLKNYVIGSRIYAIGSTYSKNSSLLEVSTPHLVEFSERTGYTTQLAKKIADDKIVYVGKYEPNNAKIITETNVGNIFYSLDEEIAGLCYQTFDERINLNGKKPNTPFIEKISGSTDHIQSIAVPIRNFENRMVGALIASDLASQNGVDKSVIKELLIIREKISRSLGFRGEFTE